MRRSLSRMTIAFAAWCASFCLLAWFLIVSAAALAATQADARRNPLGASPAVVADGERLFGRTCQTRHGPGAQGDRGPSLTTPTLVHGASDEDLYRTIRDGIRGSQMTRFGDLGDDQIWRLVAYIQSLRGAGSAAPRAGARAGTPAPPPQFVVATTKEGRQSRGERRNEDTFTLQLVDASGHLHSLDKSTLASFQTENMTAAPPEAADPAVRRGNSGVSFDRLVNAAAEPHNWMMYWGDYQGTHYSALNQIDSPTSSGCRSRGHLRCQAIRSSKRRRWWWTG